MSHWVRPKRKGSLLFNQVNQDGKKYKRRRLQIRLCLSPLARSPPSTARPPAAAAVRHGPPRRALPGGDAPQRRLRHLRRRRRLRGRAGAPSLPPPLPRPSDPRSAIPSPPRVVSLIPNRLSVVQAVDYGVHKIWEMNNLGVTFLSPASLSRRCSVVTNSLQLFTGQLVKEIKVVLMMKHLFDVICSWLRSLAKENVNRYLCAIRSRVWSCLIAFSPCPFWSAVLSSHPPCWIATLDGRIHLVVFPFFSTRIVLMPQVLDVMMRHCLPLNVGFSTQLSDYFVYQVAILVIIFIWFSQSHSVCKLFYLVQQSATFGTAN